MYGYPSKRRRVSYQPSTTESYGSMLKRSSSVKMSRRPKSRGVSFASRVRSLNGYKHNVIGDSTLNSSTTQSTIYATSILGNITQGTGDSNRQGDDIYLASLKLSGVLIAPSVSGSYAYRVLVGWSTLQLNISNSSTAFVNSSVFLPNAGSTIAANGIINPKAFTCLYDETFNVPSLIPSTQDIALLRSTISINQKFTYVSSGSTFGKTKNLFLLIIPYVAGGTNATTNTGGYVINTDVVFQEM